MLSFSLLHRRQNPQPLFSLHFLGVLGFGTGHGGQRTKDPCGRSWSISISRQIALSSPGLRVKSTPLFSPLNPVAKTRNPCFPRGFWGFWVLGFGLEALAPSASNARIAGLWSRKASMSSGPIAPRGWYSSLPESRFRTTFFSLSLSIRVASSIRLPPTHHSPLSRRQNPKPHFSRSFLGFRVLETW